jgi:DNA-binding SARP family transcriptional activator/tetratricopeptide (TPR) repeat protein
MPHPAPAPGSRPPAGAAVRLYAFGLPRVEAAGRVVPVSGRLGELLGYLMLNAHERPADRDRVAFSLWPDSPERGARRALSSALHRIHGLLPDSVDWLVASRDSLRLGDAWLDIDAFAALTGSEEPADWRAAVDLYAGDLLAGVDVEWVEEPRAELRDRATGLLARIAAEREAAGDLAGGLGWARRWSQADPLDEDAHRAVMRLYARLGRHTAALEHYGTLTRRLEVELAVAPQEETGRLARQIRSELELADRTAGADLREAFVGRDDERNALLAALDAAGAGRGGLALVLGEPGIGKSRLLGELVQSAGWRGWQVSVGAGEQFGSPGPYAPLGDALRSALPVARREQLTQTVGAAWLAGLSAMVPDLARGIPTWRSRSDTALAVAVERVLAGLAQVAPVLLVLDDMQWSDPVTWDLLERIRPALRRMPVLVAVAGRSDELRAQPNTWARLEAWDRAGVPLLHLRGLEPHDLATLSARFTNRPRTNPELGALASASGGNPLLALALLQSGDVPGSAGAATPPSATAAGDALGETAPGLAAPAAVERASLDRLFQRRLAALSPAARAALEAAAVVAQQVPYGLWQQVAGGLDLTAVVGELEASGLLRIDRDGYTFSHDTLRSLVMWGLSADRRRDLHESAFNAIRRRAPDQVLGLLFHAEQLGSRPSIAELSDRAGWQALEGLSFASAAHHFERALEVLSPDDRAARYHALLGRERSLDVLADRDAQRTDLSELDDLARALGDATRLVETARELASFHWAVGEYTEGASAVARGLEIALSAGDAGAQAALLTIHGRILREQGRLAEAREVLTRARTLQERLDDIHGTAMALELLAGVAWRLGDHPSAARQHADAAELFERIGDLRRAAHSLNSLGSALWSLGEYERARSVHLRSLATCRELGDRRGESDNLDNLGGVAWVLADFEAAIDLYAQALAIRREAHDPRGVAISLINLGDTYSLMGDVDAALAHYDEALGVDRSVGVRRNEATALQGKGKLLLDAGRAAEARACLEGAAAIHGDLRDRDNLVDTRAALARALLSLGDEAAARSHASAAVAALVEHDRPALREWVRYAAWAVAVANRDGDAEAGHLAMCAAAMDELLGSLPPDVRGRVVSRVPIHRLTMAARRGAATVLAVRLPRADLPLGRQVEPVDLVEVAWTLVDPTDTLVSDAATRRRRVAARLVDEAAAQGAAVTDDDLAAALGVSRRTIVRDAVALARHGSPLATRRRVRNLTRTAID